VTLFYALPVRVRPCPPPCCSELLYQLLSFTSSGMVFAYSMAEATKKKPRHGGRNLRFCAVHISELEGFITRHDLRAVSRIAHTLRGNAGRIGLSELSSLGRQLEEYCLGKDWSAIDSTYHAIADTVFKLCEGTPIPIKADFKGNGHVQEVRVKKVR